MAKKKAKKAKKKAAKRNNNMSVAVPNIADERRWKVEGAADAMLRIQEIKADKKLMADAKKELARREKAIKMARKA